MINCQCGHSKEEHKPNGCDGASKEQGATIGCYCVQYSEKIPDWKPLSENNPIKTFLYRFINYFRNY